MRVREATTSETFTVGYFARIAPEKGLHVLCDAYVRMRAQLTDGKARLVAAGYLPPEHQSYLDDARATMRAAGYERRIRVSRRARSRRRRSRSCRASTCCPCRATYTEPKGMFLLEAMATGVPVVQPRQGAFPEILEQTGGGLIVDADDPEALADGSCRCGAIRDRAAALGRAGAAGVREHYEVSRMAETAEAAYASVAKAASRPAI